MIKRIEFRTKYRDDRGVMQRVTTCKYYDENDMRFLFIEHVENLPQGFKLKVPALEAAESTITIVEFDKRSGRVSVHSRLLTDKLKEVTETQTANVTNIDTMYMPYAILHAVHLPVMHELERMYRDVDTSE